MRKKKFKVEIDVGGKGSGSGSGTSSTVRQVNIKAPPQFEVWQINGINDNGTYDLKSSTGAIMRHVVDISFEPLFLSVNDNVLVGYYEGSRGRPYCLTLGGTVSSFYSAPGTTLLGWLCRFGPAAGHPTRGLTADTVLSITNTLTDIALSTEAASIRSTEDYLYIWDGAATPTVYRVDTSLNVESRTATSSVPESAEFAVVSEDKFLFYDLEDSFVGLFSFGNAALELVQAVSPGKVSLLVIGPVNGELTLFAEDRRILKYTRDLVLVSEIAAPNPSAAEDPFLATNGGPTAGGHRLNEGHRVLRSGFGFVYPTASPAAQVPEEGVVIACCDEEGNLLWKLDGSADFNKDLEIGAETTARSYTLLAASEDKVLCGVSEVTFEGVETTDSNAANMGDEVVYPDLFSLESFKHYILSSDVDAINQECVDNAFSLGYTYGDGLDVTLRNWQEGGSVSSADNQAPYGSAEARTQRFIDDFDGEFFDADHVLYGQAKVVPGPKAIRTGVIVLNAETGAVIAENFFSDVEEALIDGTAGDAEDLEKATVLEHYDVNDAEFYQSDLTWNGSQWTEDTPAPAVPEGRVVVAYNHFIAVSGGIEFVTDDDNSTPRPYEWLEPDTLLPTITWPANLASNITRINFHSIKYYVSATNSGSAAFNLPRSWTLPWVNTAPVGTGKYFGIRTPVEVINATLYSWRITRPTSELPQVIPPAPRFDMSSACVVGDDVFFGPGDRNRDIDLHAGGDGGYS